MSRLQSGVRAALKDQAQGILAELENLTLVEMLALMNDPQRWRVFREKLEDALRQRLLAAAQLGQEDAGKELSRWSRFNLPFEQAQAWSRDHAAELVIEIDDHTRAVLRDEISAALQQGVAPLKLRERLKTVLGDSTDYRAARIAETEVMTAYRQGAHESFKASDAVWGEEWVAGQSGMCRVCQALNGQQVKLGQPFRVVVDGKERIIPPGQQAHPHCRCRSKPITYRQAIERVYAEGEPVRTSTQKEFNAKSQAMGTPITSKALSSVDGGIYLSPKISETLLTVLRQPALLSDPDYGDALRIYLHELNHRPRAITGDDSTIYRYINEGLADFEALARMSSMAEKLNYAGDINFRGKTYAEHREFVAGLLNLAPGEARQRWLSVPGDQLIDQVAEDVGGQQKTAALEILNRRGVEPMEKLRLLSILLRGA